MSRNELCACGSGKRYKHCHGAVVATSAPSALHREAMAAHRAGSLRRAERLYRQALSADPADVELLHMLGVVLFERMHYADALAKLCDAAERSGWSESLMCHNLGLVLAKLMSPQANARQDVLVAAYLARERVREAERPLVARVSVVLPVYNHARTVAQAIESVAAQTHADIELVVIDDGSTDDTLAVVQSCIASLACPAKVLRRAHRGAAYAANDGADEASGHYLAFLNADDRFAPARIERMVSEIARTTPMWGFSQVVDVSSDSVLAGDGGACDPSRNARTFPSYLPASFSLLNADVSRSSGNLFIARSLFRSLGGYRDVAYRGWDFCVRAAEAVEPVAVWEPLYFHHANDADRMRTVASAAQRSIGAIAQERIADALTREAVVANALCPQFAGNREFLLRSELRAGRAERLPVPMLRVLAMAWRALADAAPRRAQTESLRPLRGTTALVVLGPYRSGTSAVARVLNLCGAALPAGVIPARLGLNPTGFWETESINDLDARLLHRLGGDWNRVDFELPVEDELVDEFLADVQEVLARDYAGSPLMLVKDPRICVLAPLWQRALDEAGVRAAYVVPVRNPLEVARSLESRGDMPVADGLALWLAYMQRVEAFAERRGADVVYIRYAELLDDWRRVVRRIARQLRIPLETELHAPDIDAFLAPALRNQRAADDDLDTQIAGAKYEPVRALYRRALARCNRDATAGTDTAVF